MPKIINTKCHHIFSKILSKIYDFYQKIIQYKTSYKIASGITMLGLCLINSLFVMDNSWLVATLINKKIYQANNSFIYQANLLAGPLSDSPLYHLNQKLNPIDNKEEALLLFAKIIKATDKKPVLMANMYNDFENTLSQLNHQEKNEVLNIISNKTHSLSIKSNVFIYAFTIDSQINKEEFWLQELQLLTKTNDYFLVNEKAEIIFSVLSNKYQNHQEINNLPNKIALQEIKNYLLSPNLFQENLHGSAETWQKNNLLWQAL